MGEDGYLLRLYDRAGNRRLTGEEQAEEQAEERARAAQAQVRAEAQARQQAEERARAAQEQTARLLHLLRERGIDPGETPLS